MNSTRLKTCAECQERLVRLFAKYVRASDLLYVGAGRTSLEDGNGGPMATLLLIDDQQSLRMLLKASLERVGYRVVTAEDGRQGLRLLEQMSVDAIVVDLIMPEMDGLEFISRIRKTNPDTRIIAMSGELGYLGFAKQLGADDTISKPFSLEDILTMVSSQLNCAESRQPVP